MVETIDSLLDMLREEMLAALENQERFYGTVTLTATAKAGEFGQVKIGIEKSCQHSSIRNRRQQLAARN